MAVMKIATISSMSVKPRARMVTPATAATARAAVGVVGADVRAGLLPGFWGAPIGLIRPPGVASTRYAVLPAGACRSSVLRLRGVVIDDAARIGKRVAADAAHFGKPVPVAGQLGSASRAHRLA